MIRSIILTLVLMSCTIAVAAEKHGLVLNIGSRHLVGDDYEYNEKNYGAGYTYYKEDGDAVQIGFYDNSYDDWSVYIAWKFYGFETKYVKPYFLIGAVTGYERGPVIPMPAIGADFEIIKTHKLNLMVAPIISQQYVYHERGGRDIETNYGVLLGLQYEKLF